MSLPLAFLLSRLTFALSNILLWLPIGHWSTSAKITVVSIVYCLYMVFFTAYHIAYGSLGGAMTQNTDDRGSLYGYRLGTKMGTPTINMQFPDGVLVPRHGVYAAKVYLDDGSEHCAVTNVGVRPTVSGGQRVSVESFILDYEGNLYNRQVRLEFYKFLRPEQKFQSVDELKARILHDADTTRAYFAAQMQHA